jgi:hypothetical protein
MTTAMKLLTTTIDDKTFNTDCVGHQNEKRSLEESDTKEDNGAEAVNGESESSDRIFCWYIFLRVMYFIISYTV